MLKHTRWLCPVLLMMTACVAHADSQDAAPALRLEPALKEARDGRAPIDPTIGEAEGIKLTISTALSGSAEAARSLGIDEHARAPISRVSDAIENWQWDALWIARTLLVGFIALLMLQSLRNGLRLIKRVINRHPLHSLCVVEAKWPEVSLLLSGHPPGTTLASSLNKLLATDYPREQVHVFPVFDPASSITRSAVDRYVALDAKHIHPLHVPEKDHTAFHALQLAMPRVRGDIVIVLDGPPPAGRDWLKRCVAPFFDPAVGAIQSPTFAERDEETVLENLQALSRSTTAMHHPLSLHRTLLPGAQLSAVRCSAVSAAGGLGEESPTAEVDLVKRLAERDWHTSYQELPPRHAKEILHWPTQAARLEHDVRLTTQLVAQQLHTMLQSRRFNLAWPLRACLSPLMWLVTLVLSLALYFCGDLIFASLGLAVVAATSFNLQLSPRSFLYAASATRANGRLARIRLLPLVSLGYLVGMSLATAVVLRAAFSSVRRHKTKEMPSQFGIETELVT